MSYEVADEIHRAVVEEVVGLVVSVRLSRAALRLFHCKSCKGSGPEDRHGAKMSSASAVGRRASLAVAHVRLIPAPRGGFPDLGG